ncbi:DegQ family serine endoprotease [Mesorhizobium sp. M2D.F.Ca.ET.185.01.1.1]|uniref:DegQ family serine endoprotease n=1 Tax=unclassified Mesorhizobium TaxID=325217 RepID=UPI000FCB477E|nr:MULTISPECIES: DegQ family serine endoprotease [unclassified Mesorhizobium]TGP82178.1 DegQ family serine endoprotease [bacterium M00.F.Ca.ET.227.01.1.1]TGP91938.1 DegQ family serine endoprotease [bacterium M00.F.Ca.ET.221.01.1.1]TGP95276.1 DegQ family serine endoprotease [bacterium M00.F.Ca.ET.222.01.1.1]TGU09620.1 DegQ family serine endoprotease [bacterium M00.F.Ca.ET.163.01.1.1]TGU38794.1 DegQ family serine endoprotease [bacterium M00.F.Ca.ET.156.01.1.1]TGU47860.1 DegQ family serine endop
MSPLSILRRHRVAALLGAALIISPVVVSSAESNAGLSTVAATTQTPVAGITAPNGSFAPVIAVTKPAVVTITSIMKTQPQAGDDGSPLGGNVPFDQFFQQFFGDQGMPMPRTPPQQQGPRAEALGSGFIVGADGTIVTNNHVIDGARSIKVTLDDGTELPAKLVGHDAKNDLAVLKIKADKPLPTVKWGDSSKLMTGDQVLAIGNPFGIGTTVTAGIVSARGRDLHSGPFDDFIQIDAPINHGNSGGPLVDVNGNVIGINTAIYSPNGGSVGVGFAIPSDQAQKVIAKLMKGGDIEYGYLGVQIQPVTPDVAGAIGLDHLAGALVSSVTPGSPAAKAGIEVGDVITGFGGKEIKDTKDLSRAVADVPPGSKETVDVWRKGKAVQVSADVGRNTDDVKTASNGEGGKPSAGQGVPSLGLGLTDITPDIRQELNLADNQHGAVIERVNPDKAASAAGLQPGDVIVGVDQTPVKNARQANQAIAEAAKSGKKSVLLLVDRGDQQIFVAVPFAAG